MRKIKMFTEEWFRSNGYVRFGEIKSPVQIGVVHPEEDDEQEIWWDSETGNLYLERRDLEFEKEVDEFGIQNGRKHYNEWFGCFGNSCGDIHEAEFKMQQLLENAELL